MQSKRFLIAILAVMLIIFSAISIYATTEDNTLNVAVGIDSPTAIEKTETSVTVKDDDTIKISVTADEISKFNVSVLAIEFSYDQAYLEYDKCETTATSGVSFQVAESGDRLTLTVLYSDSSVVPAPITILFKIKAGVHTDVKVGGTAIKVTRLMAVDRGSLFVTAAHNVSAEGLKATIHNYEKGVITAPTCEEYGYTTYSCRNEACKADVVVNRVDPLGHNFKAEMVKDEYLKAGAGCTEAAVYYKSCTLCAVSSKDYTGETFSYGSALGHDFTRKDTSEKYLKEGADCEGKAVYYMSCHRCGEKSLDLTFESGEVLGHDFQVQAAPTAEYLVSAATCTNAAVYNKACTRCGAKGETYEFGAPLGHDFKVQETPTAEYLKSPADCLNAAVYYQACSRCDAKGETYTFGAALGHDFKAQETPSATYLKSAADCVNAAVYFKACTRCGEKGTETYEFGAALGHNFTEGSTDEKYLKAPATCTEKAEYYKSCTVCGEKGAEFFAHGEPLGHVFTSEKTDDEYLKDAATCTAKAVYFEGCSRCGEKGTETFEHGDVLPHTYGDWVVETEAKAKKEGSQYRLCTVCNYKDVQSIPATGEVFPWWIIVIIVVVLVGGFCCYWFLVVKKK